MHKRNRSTAVLAAGALAFAQGCHSYQRPPDGRIAPDAQVELRAEQPFTVQLTPIGAASTTSSCQATLLRGVVASQSGDTLTLSRITRAEGQGAAGTPCTIGSGSQAQVVLAAGADVAVRQISGVRTGLAIGGVILGIVILAAAAYASALGSLLGGS